jgi:hypothetical protein
VLVLMLVLVLVLMAVAARSVDRQLIGLARRL